MPIRTGVAHFFPTLRYNFVPFALLDKATSNVAFGPAPDVPIDVGLVDLSESHFAHIADLRRKQPVAPFTTGSVGKPIWVSVISYSVLMATCSPR